MFPVRSLVVLLSPTLCVLPSLKVMAQQFSESSVVYEAARNKIGLIRYCRSNQLLDPVLAGQAITAVETVLRELPSSESLPKEQGDRAQQAGEDGFWEAGRKRDIAGVAKLFRTTPADLCQEWADETLRAQKRRGDVTTAAVTAPIQPIQPLPQAKPTSVEPTPVLKAQAPRRYMEVKTIAVSPPIEPPPQAEPTSVEPTFALGALGPRRYLEVKTITVNPPIQPPLQAEPTSVEPTQVDRALAPATPVVKAALAAEPPPLAAPPPPLPEKAPFPLTAGELAPLQRTSPTGGRLASADKAVSGEASGTTAVTPSAKPQSSEQAVPLPVRLATKAAAEPLPSEQTVTAAEPRLYDQPQPLEKGAFNRLGRPERCLMRGCKWPAAPQAKRSWQY